MDIFDSLVKGSSAIERAGPYGIIVILGFVIVILYRQSRESEKGRLEDGKAFSNAAVSLTDALNKSSAANILITEQLRKVNDNDNQRALMFERLLGILGSHSQALDRLEHPR